MGRHLETYNTDKYSGSMNQPMVKHVQQDERFDSQFVEIHRVIYSFHESEPCILASQNVFKTIRNTQDSKEF